MTPKEDVRTSIIVEMVPILMANYEDLDESPELGWIALNEIAQKYQCEKVVNEALCKYVGSRPGDVTIFRAELMLSLSDNSPVAYKEDFMKKVFNLLRCKYNAPLASRRPHRPAAFVLNGSSSAEKSRAKKNGSNSARVTAALLQFAKNSSMPDKGFYAHTTRFISNSYLSSADRIDAISSLYNVCKLDDRKKEMVEVLFNLYKSYLDYICQNKGCRFEPANEPVLIKLSDFFTEIEMGDNLFEQAMRDLIYCRAPHEAHTLASVIDYFHASRKMSMSERFNEKHSRVWWYSDDSTSDFQKICAKLFSFVLSNTGGRRAIALNSFTKYGEFCSKNDIPMPPEWFSQSRRLKIRFQDALYNALHCHIRNGAPAPHVYKFADYLRVMNDFDLPLPEEWLRNKSSTARPITISQIYNINECFLRVPAHDLDRSLQNDDFGRKYVFPVILFKFFAQYRQIAYSPETTVEEYTGYVDDLGNEGLIDDYQVQCLRTDDYQVQCRRQRERFALALVVGAILLGFTIIAPILLFRAWKIQEDKLKQDIQTSRQSLQSVVDSLKPQEAVADDSGSPPNP